MLMSYLNIKNLKNSIIGNTISGLSLFEQKLHTTIESHILCCIERYLSVKMPVKINSIIMSVINWFFKTNRKFIHIIEKDDVKHLNSGNFSLPVLYNYINFSIQYRIDFTRAGFMIKLHRMNYIYSNTASGGWNNIPPVVVFVCKNTLHNRLVLIEK